MKNAFLKDSLRQVKKTINRFISILAITALGVAFFAGLRATAPDMRMTAERYYDQLNFMDVRLLSTVGFNDKDIDAIKSVKGIEGIMPAYSADALVNLPNKSLSIKLQSVDLSQENTSNESYINRPKLVQGKKPEKSDECLADPRFLKLSGYKIGDTVSFNSGNDKSLSDTLKTDKFKIVGSAENPLYISYERGTNNVGSGKVDAYIIVPSSAFKLSVYTEVYLTVQNKDNLSRFSDKYDNIIKPVSEALEDKGRERTEIRFREITEDTRKQLDNAKLKLSKEEQKLIDAEKKINESKDKIQNGEKELSKGWQKFYSQTADAQKQLQNSQEEYDAGMAELTKNEKAQQAGWAEYNKNAAQIEALKKQLGIQNKSVEELQQMVAQLNTQLIGLPEGSSEYLLLKEKIDVLNNIINSDKAYLKLTQGEASISAAKKQLKAALQQLKEASQKLNYERTKGEKELQYQQNKLEEAKAELAKAQKEFRKQKEEAQPDLEKARKSINDGEKKLSELKKPEWYVLDYNTNAGFVSFKQDAERIGAIGLVFPLIFFLVAALVSLTTMTRLVEDDREYIGTLKALGYSKGLIAAKYLLYAVAASFLGSILGLVVGFNLFPRVVFDAYGILYTLPKIIAEFNINYAFISTLSAIACAALPAYFVCIQSLMSKPASLMRPKVPQSGKRIFLERITFIWKRLNFSEKVTARNLFRYKKRLLMTIIGVAGCTALIFTGFGLRDAISTIVGRQFDEIRTYDMQIDLKDNISSSDRQKFEENLKTDKNIMNFIPLHQQSADVWGSDGVTKSVYLVVVQNGGDLSQFIHMRERTGKKQLALDNNTVIISEKLSSLLNLKKGQVMHIRNSDGIQKNLKIGGIMENYLFHYIYMAPELYTNIFGKEAVTNQELCKISNTSQESEYNLSVKMMKQSVVSSVSFTTKLKADFQDMIGAVNYVVIVLILSAAALAFVVLLSLTSINIDERSRELATIKVLGFYNRELAFYIYRENIVLTVFGTLFGLILGIFMQRFVILTSEVDLVMFSRDVLWQSYAYSAALTIFFAALVNIFMLVRFKKIDMVSSLKSIE